MSLESKFAPQKVKYSFDDLKNSIFVGFCVISGSILGPEIEENSIKKLGRKTITEKRGKKRPKEVDYDAGTSKFEPRGEGKGEG